jgi:hypothetical protein
VLVHILWGNASTFVFPLLLQHMCVHELFVVGSLLGNFGEYKGWSLWHFSISNVWVDSMGFYWLGFFFPNCVLSDLVRKGKDLCVSSAAAVAAACVCAAWAFCKGLIPSDSPCLCIDDWLGKWVVHFLCFECQAGPFYSFSAISLSKIQIQIQSLVLEASGE